MKNRIRRLQFFINPFIDKINRDNIFAIAGQSAYFLVLSVFPLSMFVVSILQNLHISVDTLSGVIGVVLNEETTKNVSEFLSNVYNDASGISLITLFVTLWSAAQGIHAITNGLNRIHNTYENRNWLFLRIRAMFYTVVFFVILLASMFVIVLGSALNEWLSSYLVLLPDIVAVIYRLRYVIIYLYLILLFALLYRNIPNLKRQQRKEFGFKYQLPGAVLCATSWLALSFGISVYVGDFNGFSIYGSLTKLAVVMIWLYFCMVCLMLGAEINYVYHDKIKKYLGTKSKKTKK